MTQPTKGPGNVSGNDDKKKGATDLRGPSAGASANPTPVQAAHSASGTVPGATPPKPATPGVPSTVSPSASKRAESWDSAGSRSPGSLPGDISKGERRDAANPSSGGSNRPVPGSGTANPTSPKGSSDGRTSPSSRDESRPVVPAQSQPVRTDKVSPQDPKQYGTSDPVQPNRPVPNQPSRVSEPIIGASGDGDSKS
jgi:hypothetical protein